MKKIIYALLTFILFSSFAYAQERDSLIQLYPGLRDTLDLFDRDYFELFQNIDGYEYAVFYIRNDEDLISKVTYYDDGLLRDTVFVQRVSALLGARSRIQEIEKENQSKLEMETEAIVILKDERIIKGRLRMFSKKYIYIISENENETGGHALDYLEVPLVKIDQIKILGSSKTWSYMAYGVAIGLLLFPINYLVGGWAYITAWILNPITDGIIGLIVGASSSRYEDVYIIETQPDILKIKDYAKYYFQYDESVEKNYVELE